MISSSDLAILLADEGDLTADFFEMAQAAEAVGRDAEAVECCVCFEADADPANALCATCESDRAHALERDAMFSQCVLCGGFWAPYNEPVCFDCREANHV